MIRNALGAEETASLLCNQDIIFDTDTAAGMK